ncbi:MAG TPA: VIT and VWA domain-containing protein [Bryobacteraceae bacterium]|nr:VIT and VWA domain-containing protein [Bryobacteraceae bacterium]
MALEKAFAIAALTVFGVALATRPVATTALAAEASSGSLDAIDPKGTAIGRCPLKHTAVQVDISGPIARVNVTQEFENPYRTAIEAVYTFPLSQRAAVDDMTMRIGDRTVKGKIKPKDEARKIYEDARNRGQLAGLLDQERPNIFTQAVANIPPGAKVKIEISYVESLFYEEGSYAFSFPMVVGPRYIPGNATGHSGGGWAPDTDRVPDASKITPPVAPKGIRAGHDISLAVKLDAGVPVESLTSTSHVVDIVRKDPHRAELRLRDQNEIPNKDFRMSWDVSGRKVADALLTHRDARGGFFTFLLQPPDRPAESEITPKEIVFVLDTSGSMSGFPIEKAKEVIKLAMDGLHERDTFNLITFAGDTHILFPQPVPATAANVQAAQRFLLSRSGGGGTEMMKAIRAALDPSDSQEHLRIVCFLTDGYVGDDMTIIGEVKRHPNARVFSFGIGSSVNRFLLDKMAEEARGEVEYVSLSDDGSAAAKRFHQRVRTPLLTDLELDWGGMSVSEVYPKRLPDLFTAKPLVIKGRYDAPGNGTMRLRGKLAGRPWSREIRVNLPAVQPEHDVMATLWARAKVDDLMSQDWQGMQHNSPKPEIKEAITKLGLDFRMMTQFTSFVAVEEKVVTEGGRPMRIDVPVEMPSGVSHEGVFGERDELKKSVGYRVMSQPLSASNTGVVGGAFGRVRQAQQVAVAPPPPPMSIPAPKMEDRRELSKDKERSDAIAKLDPALAAKTGSVRVKVWLSDASAAVLQQLKAAGLNVVAQPNGAKLVFGTIDASKLEALAKVTAVTYVSFDLGQP